jgi:hypothetical protein
VLLLVHCMLSRVVNITQCTGCALCIIWWWCTACSRVLCVGELQCGSASIVVHCVLYSIQQSTSRVFARGMGNFS